MNVVEPIRDKEIVAEMIQYFRNSNKRRSERDTLMFLFGIYTGLRISDILTVKKNMVAGKTHLVLKEGKTGKRKQIIIVPKLRRELKKYIEHLNDDDYLFYGTSKSKPITRMRAYQILNEAAEHFNLSNIGTHTMRKTFGYHFYKQNGNIAMLRHLFNHSNESVTRIYIGINQDETDKSMLNLEF